MLSATLCVEMAITEWGQSAGRIVQTSSGMMEPTATNQNRMAGVQVPSTSVRIVRSGEPSGIQNARRASTTSLVASVLLTVPLE